MGEKWTIDDWMEAIGDSKNWEVFRITPEVIKQHDFEQDYSIKYVGPIVDGCTIEEVPKVPLLYKTFAGRRELVELPIGLKKGLNYEIVEGCCKFNPSVYSLKQYSESLCSPSSVQPFNGTGSPHMIDLRGITEDAPSVIMSLLFGVNEQEVHEKIVEKDGARGDEADFFYSVQDLLDHLEYFGIRPKAEVLKFATGYTLEIKEIHKSSEMTVKASCATKHFALCSQWSPAHLCSQHCILYCLADDFEIDTDDEVLINVLGINLNGKEFKHSYSAGHDAVLNVKGENSIVSTGCPLQASGVLTITGSGTLTLECTEDMQACIGTETYTGMSYGRWEPGRSQSLKKIIVDGVRVVCKSRVPNFSLGSYGESYVPGIECKNGGSIECPEVQGKRIMIASGAEGLVGSTKRCNPAKYDIDRGTNKMSFF